MPPDGPIRVYRSELIAESVFVHGFPERTGGVSEGTLASLNLGSRRGGDPERVAENRQRVADAAGFDVAELVVTEHVHGTRVWRVDEPLPDPPEFDGLVSNAAGRILGAFAADCIPLVFADPDARVCGAAHAGWRGTVDKVAVNVVRRMAELGARPETIRAALGPSIGPCCFEVGDEVVHAFIDVFGDASGLVVAGPRKGHIDLRVATRLQLEAAGLAPDHIDDTPPCTMCNPSRFFSYRRDGSGAGCHMGYIGLR